MNRLHIHVGVADLSKSVSFYSTLFGADPTVLKEDYAKWLLDDPSVNFAISTHHDAPGLGHVGIQTDSAQGLEDITTRLKQADQAMLQQEAANCCYAVSNKTWVEDPSGLKWETFHSIDEITHYGADASDPRKAEGAEFAPTCCPPASVS